MWSWHVMICTCNLLLVPNLEHQGLKVISPYHCVLTMRYSLLAAFVALLLRSFLARRVPFPTLWPYVPCTFLVPAPPLYVAARSWRRARAGGAGCGGTLWRSSPYPWCGPAFQSKGWCLWCYLPPVFLNMATKVLNGISFSTYPCYNMVACPEVQYSRYNCLLSGLGFVVALQMVRRLRPFGHIWAGCPCSSSWGCNTISFDHLSSKSWWLMLMHKILVISHARKMSKVQWPTFDLRWNSIEALFGWTVERAEDHGLDPKVPRGKNLQFGKLTKLWSVFVSCSLAYIWLLCNELHFECHCRPMLSHPN